MSSRLPEKPLVSTCAGRKRATLDPRVPGSIPGAPHPVGAARWRREPTVRPARRRRRQAGGGLWAVSQRKLDELAVPLVLCQQAGVVEPQAAGFDPCAGRLLADSAGVQGHAEPVRVDAVLGDRRARWSAASHPAVATER